MSTCSSSWGSLNRKAHDTPQVYQFYFHKDRGLNRVMAWSSVFIPLWMRWLGVALGVMAGVLLTWSVVANSLTAANWFLFYREAPCRPGPRAALSFLGRRERR
jgi:hypothetical protein